MNSTIITILLCLVNGVVYAGIHYFINVLNDSLLLKIVTIFGIVLFSCFAVVIDSLSLIILGSEFIDFRKKRKLKKQKKKQYDKQKLDTEIHMNLQKSGYEPEKVESKLEKLRMLNSEYNKGFLNINTNTISLAVFLFIIIDLFWIKEDVNLLEAEQREFIIWLMVAISIFFVIFIIFTLIGSFNISKEIPSFDIKEDMLSILQLEKKIVRRERTITFTKLILPCICVLMVWLLIYILLALEPVTTPPG